jgi:hypothetical protein
MPFENHGNRSFTATSVDKNAPAASGVYGLSNSRQWILVGETANIQAELRNHLQYPNELLREHAASGYTFELSPEAYRVERQTQLIHELAPVGNRLQGQPARARP